MEGKGLLVGGNDGALDEEFVLAFCVQGWFLFEGLEHNCGVASHELVEFGGGIDVTHQTPRCSLQALLCQNLALRSTAIPNVRIYSTNPARKRYLWSRSLDFEGYGLRVVVCDGKGAFDEGCKGSWGRSQQEKQDESQATYA